MFFSVKLQHESAIGIHVSPSFWNSLPSPSTGLVRRFSGRRNTSSSRTHYCYIILTKEYRKEVCPFLLLENSRSLSSPWEPQIPFSSLGTLDFLSTYQELTLSQVSVKKPQIHIGGKKINKVRELVHSTDKTEKQQGNKKEWSNK